MTEQDKRPIRGVNPRAVGIDMEVERMDSENLRAEVESWSPGTRHIFKKMAKIVYNAIPEALDEELKSLTQEEPGELPEEDIQMTLDLLSLRPETLERIHIAIKEVEQMEQEK